MTSPRPLLLLLSTLSQVVTFYFDDYSDPVSDDVSIQDLARVFGEDAPEFRVNCTDNGEVLRWLNAQLERDANLTRTNHRLSAILNALHGEGSLCTNELNDLENLLTALNSLLENKEHSLLLTDNIGQDLTNIFDRTKQLASNELISCCKSLKENLNQVEADLITKINEKVNNPKPNIDKIDLQAKHTKMEIQIKEFNERLNVLMEQQNAVGALKPDESCCLVTESKLNKIEDQLHEGNKKIEDNIYSLQQIIKVQEETLSRMNDTQKSLEECKLNAKNITIIEDIVSNLTIQLKDKEDNAAKSCTDSSKKQTEIEFEIKSVFALCTKIDECHKEIDRVSYTINGNIELVKTKVAEMEGQVNSIQKTGPVEHRELTDLENKQEESLKELDAHISDRKEAGAKFQLKIDQRLTDLEIQLSKNNDEGLNDIMLKLKLLEKRFERQNKNKDIPPELAAQIDDLENQIKEANKKLKDKKAIIDDCSAKCKNLDKLNDLIDLIEDFEQKLKVKQTDQRLHPIKPTKKKKESSIGGVDTMKD